jgi:DNA-binding transcriptional ArsR family regulator
MPTDTLSTTFFALADPTRRAILTRLSRGETSVKELIRPLRISGPAVTKHLKILERSGLISRSRHAQWRPCKIEAAPLQEVATWVEHYRAYWEGSFDRLDDYLREMQKEGRPTRKRTISDSHPSTPTKPPKTK